MRFNLGFFDQLQPRNKLHHHQGCKEWPSVLEILQRGHTQPCHLLFIDALIMSEKTPHNLLEQSTRQAATLPPLLLRAGRLADKAFLGSHGRRVAGIGESFWQFRPYSTGEDATGIDWRQSAKSDHLFTREWEQQTTKTCWLWRDHSPSMEYRGSTAQPHKGERADLILLALATMLAKSGERFGWYGSGLKPSSHHSGLWALAQRLTDLATTDASFPVHYPVNRGASAVLIGDFFTTIDSVTDGLGWLSGQGVRGCLMRILDPVERSFPFTGRIQFQNVETDDLDEIQIERAETIRDAYRQKLDDHSAQLRDAAKRWGWHYFDHDTSQSAEKSLLALYEYLADPSCRATTRYTINQ